MANVHIYTTNQQPLTRFKWYGAKHWSGFEPNDTTHRCHTCERRRAAKNLVIQCYYDCDRVSCKEGHTQDRWGRWKTREVRT
jgi:hypothetical protein